MESSNGRLTRIVLGSLITLGVAVIIGLSRWNLEGTHENTVQLSQLSQLVMDGKDARLRAEKQNEDQHKTILEELKNLVPRSEYKVRTDTLELRMKEIELQIKELQVRITALELQITEVKQKIKI